MYAESLHMRGIHSVHLGCWGSLPLQMIEVQSKYVKAVFYGKSAFHVWAPDERIFISLNVSPS